jgi:outer membrane protein OmpA-like peptidoglycan-associated protein
MGNGCAIDRSILSKVKTDFRRSKKMKITTRTNIRIAALVLAVFVAGVVQIMAQRNVVNVPDGQKIEVLGLINTREPDSFVMTTPDKASTYTVHLTADTQVKSNTKGVFRGGTRYEASYLLRGLRVQVEGRGNSEGAILADAVRFNETDLRSAQMLEARMDPAEEQIRSNTERIGATEENQRRMSGQIDETTALANKAQSSADKAQSAADAAGLEAARANDRINGLDDFDPIKTIVVPFATGSSSIGPKGKAIIDEAAAWVKTQNTNGWMVAVIGFADSTGRTDTNKTLSDKRANSVIGYLITKHSLPIHRLVQPFGAGVDMPAASNDTAEGRAANRRVEIRLLLNRGIAGK